MLLCYEVLFSNGCASLLALLGLLVTTQTYETVGGKYGRRQNKLPVSVSYSAVKTLRNGSCRRRSVFTVRA